VLVFRIKIQLAVSARNLGVSGVTMLEH